LETSIFCFFDVFLVNYYYCSTYTCNVQTYFNVQK